MHYVKLWDGLLMSSINQTPVSVRWLWVTLLVQADADGMVYGTVEALARMANLTVAQTQNALDTLMAPDPASTTGDEQGKRVLNPEPNRWLVVNYRKYREMRSPEIQAALTRERVARFRERKAAEQFTEDVTHVTPGNARKRQVVGSRYQVVGSKKQRLSVPFKKPTLEEVEARIKEKGYHFSAVKFHAHYESNGWKVGKSPMKSWHGACVTWEEEWKDRHPQEVTKAKEKKADPVRDAAAERVRKRLAETEGAKS